jgi:hypothetical protein
LNKVIDTMFKIVFGAILLAIAFTFLLAVSDVIIHLATIAFSTLRGFIAFLLLLCLTFPKWKTVIPKKNSKKA